MRMTIITVLALILRTQAAYPDVPVERVAVAARAAVSAETPRVSAALLMTIAVHESDLEANAVSYVVNGRRIDRLWTNLWTPPDVTMTCGYGQTVARGRARCAAIIADNGGMTSAVAELEEWLARSHGDMRRALAGYSNGNAGFRRGRSRFGDWFMRRAEQLGMARAAS